MDNEKSKDKSRKNIVQAIGFGLLLFVLVSWLAPATRLWGLGYAYFYFFGPLGFWAFLPFCLALDLSLLFVGSLPKKAFSWRVYLGFFLFFSSLAALLSDLAYAGAESSSDYSLFFDALHAYQGDNASSLYGARDLGGGLYGYFLSSLAALGGRALVISLAIVFLTAGVLLAFYPLEKKAFLALLRKTRTAKATSSSRKARAAMAEEEENAAAREERNEPLSSAPRNDFYIAPTPSSEDDAPLAIPSPAPAPSSAAPTLSTSNDTISPNQSRSAKYLAGENSPLPQERENPEITPMISPREMARAGLQEAVFIPDAASAEAYERSLIEKRQPSAVIAPSASNTPVANEVVMGGITPTVKPETPLTPNETVLAPNEVSPASPVLMETPSTPASAPSSSTLEDFLKQPEPTPVEPSVVTPAPTSLEVTT
jgi:hypothetical protein